MMALHPLHAVARCPYHPDGDELRIDQCERAICPSCERSYPIVEGIYRLMPEELQFERENRGGSPEPIRQMAREMRQRDERAAASSMFRREPPGSPLFWMNIQFDAVSRLADIGRGAVGVDFGTGVGRYVPWLLERFEHVVAIDFSFESLRALHGNLQADQRERCLFVQCDLSRLALAPRIANGGLCVEVLQHVPEASMRKAAIAGIARTMAAGACVCLVTNAYAAARRLAGSSQTRQDGTIYSYWHTHGELRDLVGPYFEITTSRGIISYDTFPVRKLPGGLRVRVDALLERTPIGRLFGRDLLMNLRRRAS